jgi:alpha-beta hydrolase superfamily lysophospholipase
MAQLADPPILIGHSMGGLVVQKYLEGHGAPAAVLMASVPVHGVLRTTLRIARRHPLAFLKANLTWRLYPIIGRPKLCREAFFSADIPDEKLEAYFGRMQNESYLAFLDMMLFNLPKPQRIETDLLILGAEDDTIFHPEEIEATAKAYQTQPIMFSNMAHDMMLERDWQAVADRILNWLDEKGY